MVTNDIEFYSFPPRPAIDPAGRRRADVDRRRRTGVGARQEARQYIADQFKPVILVVNKWDLTRGALQRDVVRKGGRRQSSCGDDDSSLMAEYREYLDEELNM